MSPSKTSLFIFSGIAVGAVVTWVAWKFVKRKCHQARALYVAKKIHIVNTPEEWETSYMQLKKDLTTIKLLGLDCEWVQKHKVALLQLASPSGLCILVQLFKLQPSFPESLCLLLADNSILKVGVAVADDGKRLHQDYGLNLHGCVDLRHMLKRVRGAFRCPSRGLKGLAKGVLGVDISKNISIRCGNWEAETYSKEQVEYAATDAQVAVDIFLSLVFAKLESSNNSNKSFKKRRRISVHSEQSDTPSSLSADQENQLSLNNHAVVATESEIVSPSEQLFLYLFIKFGGCDNSSDVEDKNSEEDSENNPVSTHNQNERMENSDIVSVAEKSRIEYLHLRNRLHDDSRMFPSQMYDVMQDNEKEEIWKFARSMCQGIVDCHYGYHSKGGSLRPLPKQGNKTKTSAYSFRKRPLWDNCRLQAPDGSLLCTCDLRKAQWYLEKELGDTVCEDPLTVRLRFEPSNRPESERNYYLQEKKNVCVVCGYDKDYVRKFIVPFEYRKFFPSALKNHSSHDVLLLCTPCHRRSCDLDAVLRWQLAEECNAPLDSEATSRTFLDHELQKVRSAGRALLKNKNSIPHERVAELKKLLQDFYGDDNITEDLVEQAAAISPNQTAEYYLPHGKKVVDHMASSVGLLAFQSRWRQHFLNTMNPQHLPEFWSVEFVPEAWRERLCFDYL